MVYRYNVYSYKMNIRVCPNFGIIKLKICDYFYREKNPYNRALENGQYCKEEIYPIESEMCRRKRPLLLERGQTFYKRGQSKKHSLFR